ncbi:hypothetical protein GWK47_041753 [Chionoecetes opilio]|uniref:Uncharacterized protein n=1 Tax=Chionoecetes opilio TaxID=41210 RepID=A0A8J4Y9I5_CHIOP|nr:hypothetical protein GWK47_041753 [Chionoecetes opilio]
MAGVEEDAPPTLLGVSSRSLRPPLRSAARLQHGIASSVRGKCSGGCIGSEGKVRAVRSSRGLPQPDEGSIAKTEATCCTSSLSDPCLSAAPAAVQPAAPLKPALSNPRPTEHSTPVPLPLHPAAPSKATPPPLPPTVTTTSSPNSKFPPVSSKNTSSRVSAETHGSEVQCVDKDMNASMLPSTEMPCIVSGIPNHVHKEGGVGDEEGEDAEEVDGEEEDGEGDKTGKRRASRYDSADSSDR